MKWIEYKIHTVTSDADCIGGILNEIGIEGYETVDRVALSKEDEKKMFTDIPADVGRDDGLSTLIFYTEADGSGAAGFSTGSSLRDARLTDGVRKYGDPDSVIDEIKRRISDMQEYTTIKMPEFEYFVVDDSLWKDRWKENFKPFRAAKNIIVKPSWEDDPKDIGSSDIVVEIDPGQAFGTGSHETTKLCLRSLEKLADGETTVLDVGCGSGILGISALLLGAKAAYCVDVDEFAVKSAKENAVRNNIKDDRFKAVCANMLEDGELVKAEFDLPADIAVANILADVIVRLSENIGEFIKDGGFFISSGILAGEADKVEEALVKGGFESIKKNVLGEWASFEARKKKRGRSFEAMGK